MDKDKQIKEMAKDICGLGRDCHGCTASGCFMLSRKRRLKNLVVFWNKMCEVIGNIHDNPELLESEDTE